jgi:hypothetical protein
MDIVDVVSNVLEGENEKGAFLALVSSLPLSAVLGWSGFGGSSTSVSKERWEFLNSAALVALVTTSDCVGEYALAVGSQGQACF